MSNTLRNSSPRFLLTCTFCVPTGRQHKAHILPMTALVRRIDSSRSRVLSAVEGLLTSDDPPPCMNSTNTSSFEDEVTVSTWNGSILTGTYVRIYESFRGTKALVSVCRKRLRSSTLRLWTRLVGRLPDALVLLYLFCQMEDNYVQLVRGSRHRQQTNGQTISQMQYSSSENIAIKPEGLML